MKRPIEMDLAHDTEQYFAEYRRMCDYYKRHNGRVCSNANPAIGCPLVRSAREIDAVGEYCRNVPHIELVESWAKDHPHATELTFEEGRTLRTMNFLANSSKPWCIIRGNGVPRFYVDSESFINDFKTYNDFDPVPGYEKDGEDLFDFIPEGRSVSLKQLLMYDIADKNVPKDRLCGRSPEDFDKINAYFKELFSDDDSFSKSEQAPAQVKKEAEVPAEKPAAELQETKVVPTEPVQKEPAPKAEQIAIKEADKKEKQPAKPVAKPSGKPKIKEEAHGSRAEGRSLLDARVAEAKKVALDYGFDEETAGYLATAVRVCCEDPMVNPRDAFERTAARLKIKKDKIQQAYDRCSPKSYKKNKGRELYRSYGSIPLKSFSNFASVLARYIRSEVTEASVSTEAEAAATETKQVAADPGEQFSPEQTFITNVFVKSNYKMQKDFAQAIDYSSGMVSRALAGKCPIGEDMIAAVSHIYPYYDYEEELACGSIVLRNNVVNFNKLITEYMKQHKFSLEDIARQAAVGADAKSIRKLMDLDDPTEFYRIKMTQILWHLGLIE